MEDVPGLPYQTIVREYEGNEAMSRLYAANDAERLAEQGWRVLYTSRVETTKESGCLSTLLQLALFHYTLPKEKRYVIRVTYALGVKHKEQSSPSYRLRREAQRGVRHPIAAAGVVLMLPDDWQVMKGDMSASARRQRGPIDGGESGVDAAGGVPAADHAVPFMAWRGADGLKLQVEPTEQRTLEAMAADVRPGPAPTSDVDPSVEYIDLPAGKAVRVRAEGLEAGQTIVSTHYILVVGGLAYDMVFASPDPPEDDWLSIAETIEFLPEQG